MATFMEWLQDELQNDETLSGICDYVMIDVRRRIGAYSTNQAFYNGETNPVYLLTAFSLFEHERAVEVLYTILQNLDTSLVAEELTEELLPHIAKASEAAATEQELQDALNAVKAVLRPDPEKGDIICRSLFMYQAIHRVLEARVSGWVRGDTILSAMNLVVAHMAEGKEDVEILHSRLMGEVKAAISLEEFLYVGGDPQNPRFDDVIS